MARPANLDRGCPSRPLLTPGADDGVHIQPRRNGVFFHGRCLLGDGTSGGTSVERKAHIAGGVSEEGPSNPPPSGRMEDVRPQPTELNRTASYIGWSRTKGIETNERYRPLLLVTSHAILNPFTNPNTNPKFLHTRFTVPYTRPTTICVRTLRQHRPLPPPSIRIRNTSHLNA